MITLKENSTNNYFSHIYIEKDIINNEITKDIVKKFKKSKIIIVKHYKNIFSNYRQFYDIQKLSPKLILAQKTNNFFYKGSDYCYNYGFDEFYYTNQIINCLYNCKYCYLRGLYPSANVVFFVNYKDYFRELKRIIPKKKVYLSLSYESDILTFERIYPIAKKWMEFVDKNENIHLEIRTKSNVLVDYKIKNGNRINFAFTLSPNSLIRKFELKTPSLEKRIENINRYIKIYKKVNIIIDPVIKIENWKTEYELLLKNISDNIDEKYINKINIGFFRLSKDNFKKIKKLNKDYISLYPYSTNRNIVTYSIEEINEMKKFFNELINKYFNNIDLVIY